SNAQRAGRRRSPRRLPFRVADGRADSLSRSTPSRSAFYFHHSQPQRQGYAQPALQTTVGQTCPLGSFWLSGSIHRPDRDARSQSAMETVKASVSDWRRRARATYKISAHAADGLRLEQVGVVKQRAVSLLAG